MKLARELRAAYPAQPQMQFIEIVSLYESKKYEESRNDMLDYLQSVTALKPGFRKSFTPRVLTAIGDTYLAEKSYDKAAEYFTRAADTLKEDPKRPPARWAVWGMIKLGNVYDLEGLRPKALEIYRQARGYKDSWGFSESLDRYEKKPFSESELPVPIPPP